MQVNFNNIEEQSAPAVDLTIKLNGAVTKFTDVDIYAPTESGEDGLFLKSQGEGQPPTWESLDEYQKVNDDALNTEDKTVPGAINEVNDKVDDLAETVETEVDELKQSIEDVDLTLNGSSKKVSESDFYAPIASGTTGQLLQSQGANSAPTWVDNNSSMPVGMITPFAGSTAPAGWLLCNGGSYSFVDGDGVATQYFNLYKVIGTTYGGSGSSFNVPDLRGKFLEGAGTATGHTLGSKLDAALPTPSMTFSGNSHSGWINLGTTGGGVPLTDVSSALRSGVFTSFTSAKTTTTGSTNLNSSYAAFAKSDSRNLARLNISWTDGGSVSLASSNTIYGKSTTVQPASVCINYIIKY